MFDHIIKGGDSEADALALLPDYHSDGDWRGDVVIPNLKIITADAVWDTSDPQEPVLVSAEESLPGFWLAIALPEVSQVLIALPNDACRLIADREAAGRGEEYIRYVSPAVEPSMLTTATVAPVFAGSAYPFGSGASEPSGP